MDDFALSDAAALAVKLLLYAATLGAAGGTIFLLLFARQLTSTERGRIARL